MKIFDRNDWLPQEAIRKYISISEGYDLHFWGNGSLLVLIKNRYHFRFTEIQTDILEKCDGKNRVSDVVDEILSLYHANSEQITLARNNIMDFLANMLRKGYLCLHTNQKEYLHISESPFSGVRGKFYPYDISIELTSRCNFNCSFCYKNSKYCGEDIEYTLIDYISNTYAGKIKEIRLMGGEPTIYPYFERVVDCLSHNFLLSVVTNGSVLYRYSGNTIQNINALQFSLYGYSRDTYQQNTGSDGWHAIKKSVDKANQFGIETKGCITLSRDSIDHFEQYVKAAIELGIKKLSFGVPAPAGRAVADFDEVSNRFSDDDKTYIYKLMREMKLKYLDKIEIIAWQHGRLSKDKEKPAFEECNECLDCGAGWYSLVISETGHIRPCELLDSEVFDYGDLHSIEKIANGYFFAKELCQAIPLYKKSLDQHGIALHDICPTLERFEMNNPAIVADQ